MASIISDFLIGSRMGEFKYVFKFRQRCYLYTYANRVKTGPVLTAALCPIQVTPIWYGATWTDECKGNE